mmetsp:Transcript_22133/g.32992  ORF Transcript_22133/g.32992 Transcript_22133/m.32992 type:complete len:104 (+) Transcript_22133:75-386(+)
MSDESSYERAINSNVVQKARNAGAYGGILATIGVGATHGLLEYAAPKAGITFYSNIKNWRFKLMLGTMAVFANTWYQGEQALYDGLRAEGKSRIEKLDQKGKL